MGRIVDAVLRPAHWRGNADRVSRGVSDDGRIEGLDVLRTQWRL